jgi:DNA adenine methylase
MPKLVLTKYHGGSFYTAPWIISHFPLGYTDRPYAEPFGGGFNVGLQKLYSITELYNDIDFSIYNIFKQLKKDPDLFIKFIQNNFSYTEETFNDIKSECVEKERILSLNLHKTDIEYSGTEFYYAVYNLILRRFSRGGNMKNYSTSNRIRRGYTNGDEGSFKFWAANILPRVAQRIRCVNFYNEDAMDFIRKIDGYGVTLFIDPPWLPETRTAKKVYKHEMSREDHEKLLKLIVQCDSNIIILGYNNELYSDYLKDWERRDNNVANHSGQNAKKQRRTVSLWRNYK